MKHLKQFEFLNQNEPQIGDYVLCHEEDVEDDDDLTNFIDNNIGKIIGIDNTNTVPFDVEYENVPDNIRYHFTFYTSNDRLMTRKEIIYFSPNKPNKEELEAIKQANKFNI